MLSALVTATLLQQEHLLLAGSSESALPVTCLMFKKDMEDLGISIMIRSVFPGSACDLSRSMNKYVQVSL